MTKHTKIALSASRDIPFNLLVLSQSNVRRVKGGISIDALAADIARRGLLQSLTVRAERDGEGNPTGKFEVPAGGRRFRALQQLVNAKRLARTAPVPCIVREDDAISAEEGFAAENTHREALHPLDQFRAMHQLASQGSDVETIAATFMTTPAVVKQRLRLASVSPKLHDIYAEDGMTLEQLMAFSVSEYHARQEQVWEQLQSSYNKQPYMIRSKLTEQAVRATDKRARFVGLENYVAAGGYVLRDLFEDDGRLDFFESALAFMAGYGLKAFLIAQSLNQIEKAYGPNNAILDNCHVRVSFATNDERTAKRISDALGTATEMRAMKNYAGHRLSPWLGHLMVSRTETARALLTPGEVMQLPPDDEIVMVAGVHPIRALKVRYYADPRLKARVIAPPSPEGRPPRANDWSSLPVPEGSTAAAGKGKDEDDAANGGIRREPELPVEQEIVPPPPPPPGEFEFDDAASDDAAAVRRRGDRMRGAARQASLDPGDGVQL